VVAEARVSGPATLLAFTDGAVERRGEVIDTGLERLRATAAAADGLPLATVLDRLMQMPTVHGGRDDTVILGLRWTGGPNTEVASAAVADVSRARQQA
jgi:hypothetical protein